MLLEQGDTEQAQLECVLSNKMGVLPLDQLDLKEAEVLGVIGEGSYGVVYRASWQGSIVAIKVLKAARAETQNEIGSGCSADEQPNFPRFQRLGREIAILKSVRHPNIVVRSVLILIRHAPARHIHRRDMHCRVVWIPLPEILTFLAVLLQAYVGCGHTHDRSGALTCFIIMAYVSGGVLTDHLVSTRRAFRKATKGRDASNLLRNNVNTESVNLAIQLAAGISYLHAMSIIQ
jgi:serine/threonine protein kinase